MRVLKWWLPAWLVVLGGAGAPAMALVPQSVSAEAGARSFLLGPRDLGPGWSANGRAPSRVAFVTCSLFSPVTRVRPSSSAGAPTYARGSAGPFLTQSAYAYASHSGEATVWTKVARPALVRCLAASLAQHSGAKVLHKGMFPLPGLSASAVGYQVKGTLSSSGTTVDVYLDMILVGGGRAISALVFSSLEQPISRSLELRLASAAARRVHG